jgi:hypothetical protein
MNKDYFESLGFKTLQSWLKNCNSGKIILYTENFDPVWPIENTIINWQDENYNKLEILPLDLPDEWKHLRDSLNGRAKNFIWKAVSWIDAVRRFKGTVTFFDADLICFQDPKNILDTFVANSYDISFLSVKDVRPHADSCFYSINTNSPNLSLIIQEYSNQYLNIIKTPDIYPKPYDAPVLAKTIDILKNNISIWDFNENSSAKSPLKDTILNVYFRHLKGNQKDSGRLLGIIDKTINAIDKDKSIEDVLNRFDRKLRQDDSKRLDVPF